MSGFHRLAFQTDPPGLWFHRLAGFGLPIQFQSDYYKTKGRVKRKIETIFVREVPFLSSLHPSASPVIIKPTMNDISIWAAFAAGIASFFTPCVLPMVPVYLASLAGPEILEKRAGGRWSLFLHSLSFVAGMATIFTLTGTLAGLAGININPASPLVRQVSGGLLIFFGLFMLGAGFIPRLNFEKRFSPKMVRTRGYLASFVIGASFTVAWTPCLSPILASVLTIALNSETAGKGAVLLASYSFGLGLPFLLMGAFFTPLTPVLKRIGRFSRWVYFASGALLLIAGILILFGKLNFLYIR